VIARENRTYAIKSVVSQLRSRGYAPAGKRVTTSNDLYEAIPIKIVSTAFALDPMPSAYCNDRSIVGRPFSSHFLTLGDRTSQGCNYRMTGVTIKDVKNKAAKLHVEHERSNVSGSSSR